MIKLIIFDLGGVIVNYDEIIYADYISNKFDIPLSKFLKAFDFYNTKLEVDAIKTKEMYRGLSKEFHIPIRDLDWNPPFRNNAKLNLEVVNFANNLTKKYKVAILSNLTISRYLYLRKKFLPKLKFDKMFFSCYLKMRKPDKGIFDYVVNYFKIKPEEVLFIDNMEENIEGAKKLGITAILFDIDSDWKNEIKKVLNKN